MTKLVTPGCIVLIDFRRFDEWINHAYLGVPYGVVHELVHYPLYFWSRKLLRDLAIALAAT